MATLNDRVFDNGLTVLDTEANKISNYLTRGNNIHRG